MRRTRGLAVIAGPMLPTTATMLSTAPPADGGRSVVARFTGTQGSLIAGIDSWRVIDGRLVLTARGDLQP